MAGLVPTATQLGYAIGLFALVPLGDLVERRRLIVLQFVLLGVTLIAAATAPTAWMLAFASLLVGMAATVAQQIVPFAATLAPPQKRGAAIGAVMSGLSPAFFSAEPCPVSPANFWAGAPPSGSACRWRCSARC